MCITAVQKDLHPHKKIRQLNLRNTRPKITQMIRLENQTPYPIRDFLYDSLFYVHGFHQPASRDNFLEQLPINWLPVLTNSYTLVRFGYSAPATLNTM